MELEKKYYTVQDSETLKLMFQHIQESEVIAVDTETSGLNPRKDKVVGWSLSGDEGIGFYIPTLVWNFEKGELELQTIDGTSTETISKNLLKALKGKKLVFHNASFDVQFIKNYFNVDLIEDIWVDTGLLVHTVNEEGAFGYGNPFGLKSIAIMNQEALGLNVEEAANQEQIELKENIKKNGGSVTKASFEIYKADLDILSKYASADTDLTLRICNLYLGKLRDQKYKSFITGEEYTLWDFFFEEEVMPIYREVTIPMESKGVDLDMDLLKKTHAEITQEMSDRWEAARKDIMDVKKNPSLHGVQEWIIAMAIDKFPFSHKGNFGQELAKRYSLSLPRSEKTGKYSLTKKNIEELEDSKVKDFLLTGKTEFLDETEATRISLSMWKESNDNHFINFQSGDHMASALFNFCGLAMSGQDIAESYPDEFTIDYKKKSSTIQLVNREKYYYVGASGIPSGRVLQLEISGKSKKFVFDVNTIRILAEDYDFAKELLIYNRLLKIKSTYVDRFLDRNEDGRYYFYFKQNGTVSGRYGSDAQQLPKPLEEGEADPVIMKYVNIVRAFLIAGKGRKVIDADYESLEPHCFASVTGDQGLQEIFNKGWDFYSTVAIKTEKLDQQKDRFPNGVSADKKSPVFLKKLDPVARNKAKAYSLGLAYGMEAYALAMGLFNNKQNGSDIKAGMENPAVIDGRPNRKAIAEAEELVKGYFDGFPQLKEWRERSREQVKAYGFITNYVDRVRHLDKVNKIYHTKMPDNSTIGDRMMDWRFRKELERMIPDKADPKSGKIKKASEIVLQKYRDYRNGLNNCLNFQLQSLAAAVVNRAALKINQKAKELGIDAICQAQVHDQLIINCDEKDVEMFAPYVQEIMENTTKLPGVTLKAPPEISNNWRDGH